ncbi:MAG: tRNA (adenosine(37)-N6)-threonylcarbamoyltransferase complex ATPase subunit type 1 TsaE [Acidimicrobiales bacterium]
MITVATKSADDTRELGVALSSVAQPGDLILLAGDLGAGKTTLAQGFGRGLGVDEPIISPTFVLARIYKGRLPLVHADAYRMENLNEVSDLDLAELLDDGSVALVEWGDVIAPVVPANYLELRLEFGPGDDDRAIRIRPVGTAWSIRLGAVRTALGRWQA